MSYYTRYGNVYVDCDDYIKYKYRIIKNSEPFMSFSKNYNIDSKFRETFTIPKTNIIIELKDRTNNNETFERIRCLDKRVIKSSIRKQIKKILNESLKDKKLIIVDLDGYVDDMIVRIKKAIGPHEVYTEKKIKKIIEDHYMTGSGIYQELDYDNIEIIIYNSDSDYREKVLKPLFKSNKKNEKILEKLEKGKKLTSNEKNYMEILLKKTGYIKN